MKFDLKDYYKGNLTWLCDKTIFLTKAGSQAYGTNVVGSDLDVRGICAAPKNYVLGCFKKFEQCEIKGDPDIAIFELRKFLQLASSANPNIIEFLFTDSSDWLKTTSIFEKLYENRELFLSKKIKFSFHGYGISQLNRMKTHRNFILNPPKEMPTRETFDLPKMIKMPKDQVGALDELMNKEKISEQELPENFILLLQKEKAYQQAKRQWEQYQEWKNTRNPKRFALEDKCGYDPKNAMHLVRLITMCEEIMTTGKVIVKRPDREFLLEIRSGKWSYEQLIDWANEKDKILEEIYKTSTILPHSVDHEKIDNLCVELIEESFKL